MFKTLKTLYDNIRYAHFNIQSLMFVKIVIMLSFVPILFYLGAWIYALYGYSVGTNVTMLISILNELRQFVAVIFSTQVVSGVIAYGVALIDRNNDGESDELEVKASSENHQTLMPSRDNPERRHHD